MDAPTADSGTGSLSAQFDKFAPIRLHDGTYGLSEDRLDWHLENWTRWESARWDAELMVTMSEGHSSTKDFEQMCMEMDQNHAQITKAAIESLTPVESSSVFCKLVRSVFRFRDSIDEVWMRARWRLRKDLYRRGLV